MRAQVFEMMGFGGCKSAIRDPQSAIDSLSAFGNGFSQNRRRNFADLILRKHLYRFLLRLASRIIRA
jgi:hypothetical protein